MLPSNVGLTLTNAERALTNAEWAPANAERDGKVGSAWKILAPAKLNLYLEVLGHRADGFHSLETLMVPVRVYDQLLWQPCDGPATGKQLTLRVRNLLPIRIHAHLGDGNGDNLVLRAARLLAKTAGIEPHGRFDLFKRIPIQAGMGGGSSDAAAALLLANQAWDLGYSLQQLQPLAAQLGSDVPFFLHSSAAICRGRGELIEPVDRLPRLHFVIAKPTFGLSTADVFRQLRARRATGEMTAMGAHSLLSPLIEKLQRGNVAAAGQSMTNRLETAAAQLAPWLVRVRTKFSELNCLAHFMTGSGSAYVGVMRTATQARNAARRLGCMNIRSGLNLENVFATSS